MNFTLEATIDTRKSTSFAGVGIIGGANNGFGAPLAGIGVSVKGEKVEVWKTVDGSTTVLTESSMDVSEIARVRMVVRDGYKLDFEYLKDDKWNTLAKNVDASPYVPWGMGFRIGLCAKGEEGDFVNFRKIRLIH